MPPSDERRRQSCQWMTEAESGEQQANWEGGEKKTQVSVDCGQSVTPRDGGPEWDLLDLPLRSIPCHPKGVSGCAVRMHVRKWRWNAEARGKTKAGRMQVRAGVPWQVKS